ncbi:MAG: HNH endonuclease [Clostridiales Family XIII bacterium]|jgi:hypothetical protein|nr:HNH endonuclease [Clostridiales Family XIII bacterium]
MNSKHTAWTDKEIERLRRNYNCVTNDGLSSLFPSRSRQAIYKKAYSLGLRKTPEIEFANRSEVRVGSKGASWKGGIRYTKKGYRQILRKGHHRADAGGYVMEHIAVWERETGIKIPLNCCIHHISGNKTDNRIENLCLMEKGAHTVLHHLGAVRTEETRKRISDKKRSRSGQTEAI